MERRERRTDLSLNRIKREVFCDRKDRLIARTRRVYSVFSSFCIFHPRTPSPRPPPRKVRDVMCCGDVVLHYSRPICGRSREREAERRRP